MDLARFGYGDHRKAVHQESKPCLTLDRKSMMLGVLSMGWTIWERALLNALEFIGQSDRRLAPQSAPIAGATESLILPTSPAIIFARWWSSTSLMLCLTSLA